MSVVLDTGVLVAFQNREDPLHAKADAIMKRIAAGEHGTAYSTDHVLGEGLTLLRRRPGRASTSQSFADLFWDKEHRAFDWLVTDEATLRAATELHLKAYPRGLSFVDCTLIIQARERQAAVATFDGGFAGLIDVVAS